MQRYCETSLGILFECGAGWGSMDSNGVRFCYDEPIEDNCRNIVSGGMSDPGYATIGSEDRERMKIYPPLPIVCRHCGQEVKAK